MIRVRVRVMRDACHVGMLKVSFSLSVRQLDKCSVVSQFKSSRSLLFVSFLKRLSIVQVLGRCRAIVKTKI